MQRFLHNLLPWLIVILAYPTLMLFNGFFAMVFPAPGADPMSFFRPENNLLQASYVYQSKSPHEVFGNFYYALGSQLAARGQLPIAEQILQKSVKANPENALGFLNYAIVLENLEKDEEAIKVYGQAIEVQEDLVEAYYRKGLLHDKLGNTDKGIEVLKEALAYNNADPMLHYDIGVLYAKKLDFVNSAEYSRLAFELKKDFAEAYNNYAYALTNLGQHEDALVMIDLSLNYRPDSAASIDTKGFALQGLKRYDEALELYNQAIELDDTIGEIFYHRAQVLDSLNRHSEAIQDYQKYLELEANGPFRDDAETRINVLTKQLGENPTN